MSTDDDKSLPFSTLLNLLFEHVRDGDGQTYTDAAVAKTTGISQSSLSALRRNITNNPRLDNVKAVANFFGVSLNYFAAESLEEGISLIASDRHQNPPDVELATRLTNLSDEARNDLERILAWVQKADRVSK